MCFTCIYPFIVSYGTRSMVCHRFLWFVFKPHCTWSQYFHGNNNKVTTAAAKQPRIKEEKSEKKKHMNWNENKKKKWNEVSSWRTHINGYGIVVMLKRPCRSDQKPFERWERDHKRRAIPMAMVGLACWSTRCENCKSFPLVLIFFSLGFSFHSFHQTNDVIVFDLSTAMSTRFFHRWPGRAQPPPLNVPWHCCEERVFRFLRCTRIYIIMTMTSGARVIT